LRSKAHDSVSGHAQHGADGAECPSSRSKAPIAGHVGFRQPDG